MSWVYNPLLQAAAALGNSSPTVALNTPADTATTADNTPDLVITGTDEESNDIRYNVQVHTNNAFGGVATITKDASASSENTTTSFTVGSHDNRLLLVSYSHYQGGGGLSGVTYNGDALSLIYSHEGQYGEVTEIWGLVAPDTGTHDLVVSGSSTWFGLGILSLYNCSQTLPHNTAWAEDTTYCEITTGHDGSWVVSSIESEAAITQITGTEYWNLEGDVYQHGAGAYILKSTAGVQGMDWSQSYGSRSNQVLIEVEAYVETALIDKVSGTDAGFSGSPDNTDPFTSGQQVTYTVQSALSPGTYYWRVRAIDPSGSNIYGAWSEIRSFTITAGTIVSDTRPARTKGKAVASDNRPARTKGKETASDIRAGRTKGKTIASDIRAGRTKGIATTSDTRSGRTKGKITTSDIRAGRTKGKNVASSAISARTHGKLLTSDTRTGHTKGSAVAADTRAGRTYGRLLTSDTRPGRTKGKDLSADSRGAHTKGVIPGVVVSSTRPARTKGVAISSDVRTGHTYGKNLGVDTRQARTKGKAISADTRSGRTKGKNIAVDTRAAHSKGKDTLASARSGRTKGIAVASSSRPSRTKGIAIATAIRLARTIGNALASAIRAARTIGTLIISSDRPARTVGKATVNDNRGGHTKGHAIVSDSRGGRTAGIYNASSNRGARTRGKGSLSRPGASLYNRGGELYNNQAGGLYNRSSNPSTPRGGLANKRI